MALQIFLIVLISTIALPAALGFTLSVDCGFEYGSLLKTSVKQAKIIGYTRIQRTPLNESAPLIKGVYETYRYSAANETEWGYDVTVPPGFYNLKLQFAETDPNIVSVGKRRFGVKVQGVVQERALDIFREAGNRSMIPIERSYSVRVKNNILSIRLFDSIGDAKLHAFHVVRAESDEISLPYHMNVGSDFETDGFKSDEDSYRTSDSDTIDNSNSNHPKLFRTGRVGTISYEFPVRRGPKYDVSLHFAELDDANMREGARVFHAQVNSDSEWNIDVYKEAGSKHMTYTFKSVPENDGKIKLELEGQSGSPILNAISIYREGGHVSSGKSVLIRAMNLGGDAMQGFEADDSEVVVGASKSVRADASWIESSFIPEIYRTYREQTEDSGIQLSISVDEADRESYTVDLLFAETENSGFGDRIMDVLIDGARKKTVDIYEIFGASKTGTVRFSRLERNENGKIEIQIVGTKGNAVLSGFNLYKDSNDGKAPAWRRIDGGDDSEALARHENCAVHFNGDIYLIGGRRLQPVTKFDINSRKWSSMEPPPIEVHHMQCAVVDNRIVIGMAFTGEYPNEAVIDRLLWYHPLNDSWTWGATIPENRNRGSTATVVRDGTLYFINGNIGGHGGHARVVNWFDAYNVEDDSWSELPDTPAGRDHGMATIAGDCIVVVGGRDSGHDNVFDTTISQVDVWRFNDNRWDTSSEVLPDPNGGTLVSSVDDRYVVVAGGEGYGIIWPRTVIFDVNDMRFVDLAQPNMITPRHGTQLVRCENTLYAACGSGWQGGEPELSSVEAFTIDGRYPEHCEKDDNIHYEKADKNDDNDRDSGDDDNRGDDQNGNDGDVNDDIDEDNDNHDGDKNSDNHDIHDNGDNNDNDNHDGDDNDDNRDNHDNDNHNGDNHDGGDQEK